MRLPLPQPDPDRRQSREVRVFVRTAERKVDKDIATGGLRRPHGRYFARRFLARADADDRGAAERDRAAPPLAETWAVNADSRTSEANRVARVSADADAPYFAAVAARVNGRVAAAAAVEKGAAAGSIWALRVMRWR